MQIKLVPDPSLFAIVVIFLLNYLVVRRFFLKPVLDVIDARESEIGAAERLHEEALSRLNQATADIEAKLHTAKREASAVRDRFRADAGAHRNKVIERTQGEAKAIVAEADQKLSGDVKVARETITRESENLARLAAERILGRPV